MKDIPKDMQMDLFEGILEKELGLDQVEGNNTPWVQVARSVATVLAREHGEVCADDVRKILYRHNLRPRHPNAWGAVFRGGFEFVRFKRSEAVSRHSSVQRVWRLAE